VTFYETEQESLHVRLLESSLYAMTERSLPGYCSWQLLTCCGCAQWRAEQSRPALALGWWCSFHKAGSS